jgi:hypothetical protein
MIHHLGERDGIMYSVQYQIIIIAGCRTSQPPLFNCSVVVSYRAFGRLLLCTSPGVLEIVLGRAAFRSVDTQHARPADAEKSSRALMQPAPNSVPLSQSFTLRRTHSRISTWSDDCIYSYSRVPSSMVPDTSPLPRKESLGMFFPLFS